MKQKDPRFKVGIVLTVLGAMLFLAVFSLNSTRAWWQGAATVSVRFETVQGIRVDDPVHFHGVPCGRVSVVQFVGIPEDGNVNVAYAATAQADDSIAVLLQLEIPLNVRSYLRDGSKATIEKTLTGVTVIQLHQGDGEPLPDNVLLDGTPGTTIDEVTAGLNDAVKEVQAILTSLRLSLDDATEEGLIVGTLRALKETTSEANLFTTELRSLLKDNKKSVQSALEGCAGFMATLDERLQSLPTILQRIEDTFANTGELTDDVRSWFRSARAELSSAVEDVAASADNLETLSTELRHRPWRLLHAPSEEEALALDIYESATKFGRGALELRRALDSVQDLLRADQEDPAVRALLERASKALSGQVEMQDVLLEAFRKRLLQLDH